jgi:hypothetical protein
MIIKLFNKNQINNIYLGIKKINKINSNLSKDKKIQNKEFNIKINII